MALSMGTYTPASNNTGYQSPASTGFQGVITPPTTPTATVSGAPKGFDIAPGATLQGNYNYTGSNLTASSGSSPTAVSPVITASAAQKDYQDKLTNFKYLSDQISQQRSVLAQQAVQKAANDAEKAANDAKAKLDQQGMNIQQQQADTAAKDAETKHQAVVMAGQEGTSTGTTSTGTTATTPTTPTTPADTTQTNLSNALTTRTTDLSTVQTDRDALTKKSNDALQSLLNGTIPLSAPQQSLITSLQSQLIQNENDQKQANDAYTGAITMDQMRHGGEYDVAQTSGAIHNAISTGVAKIQALDNKAATTIAQLEQSFQKDNFDIINKQYDILTKALDDKSAAIKDTYETTTKALQDQRDFNQRASQFAQDQKLKEQQFAETQKKDAADIQHQKTADAIASADLKLNQAKYNATYGIFTDSSGKPVSGANIPGTTKGANGVSYMDLSQFTNPEQQTAAANLARRTGMPIVTTQQAPAVRSWQNVNSLLNKVQNEYQNASQNKGGLQSYQNDVANLDAALKDLSTKDPAFATISTSNIGNLGLFDFHTNSVNMTAMNNLRDGLNRSMGSMIPNMPAPIFGQTFTSPAQVDQWAQQTGNTQIIANLKASYPNATAEDILKIVNTGQE